MSISISSQLSLFAVSTLLMINQGKQTLAKGCDQRNNLKQRDHWPCWIHLGFHLSEAVLHI